MTLTDDEQMALQMLLRTHLDDTFCWVTSEGGVLVSQGLWHKAMDYLLHGARPSKVINKYRAVWALGKLMQ